MVGGKKANKLKTSNGAVPLSSQANVDILSILQLCLRPSQIELVRAHHPH